MIFICPFYVCDRGAGISKIVKPRIEINDKVKKCEMP